MRFLSIAHHKGYILLLLALLAAMTGSSAGGAETDRDKPLFSRHIEPLFSRLGCNAGTCHGAVKGQNGFRLSLFSAGPAQDYESIVREHGGRRLNRHEPAKSLLLLKAAGQVPHEGGKRMSVGDPNYQMLYQWVLQGAPLDEVSKSRVRKLAVAPQQKTLKAGESYDLKVEATFADGSTEDVTDLCTFEALDDQVATVNVSGKIEAHGVGDSAVVVRLGAEPVMAIVVVPRQGKEPFPSVKTSNFVDEHVVNKLRLLNIHPSGLCDDAAFLRRVSLDVNGALPAPEEIRQFLADQDPNKRSKKIDELLTRPGYAALWATKFCDLLKASNYSGNLGFIEPAENRRFYEWIRARLQENSPYDQFVERILTATSYEGRSQDHWLLQEVMALAEENARESADLAVYSKRRTLDLYWQRQDATGLKGTLQVAHSFLGLRLECAQCHRHPHDVWKQDDLLSFANFFMQVKGARYPNTKGLPPNASSMVKKSKNEAKKLSNDAKKLLDRAKNKKLAPAEAEKLRKQAEALQFKARVMTNGPKRFGTDIYHQTGRTNYASVSSPLGTQRSNQFRLLKEDEPIKVAKENDPRRIAVEWMRRPDNPFFARAICNRVWAHYFGRGIVDPPDHLSPLNPASNPELLSALATGFIKNKFDLKWLHRTILASRTYQLSSTPNDTNRTDRKNYSYFYLRRVPAEVMVDAINHATAGREEYPAKLFLPKDAKAIEVAGVTRSGRDSASLAYAFQIFGRPLRSSAVQCDCQRDSSTTIVQTLYLANHPRVRKKIADPNGRVAQLLKKESDQNKQIEAVYLWTVSRLPTAEEVQTCLTYLKESESPQKGFEDIMWSLLNTREFLLNH